MSSALTKSLGLVPEPVPAELEAVLESSDDAFVLYDASGEIRVASERLRQLLTLSDREWTSLRDFSSFSRVLASRLADGTQRLRPPWLLWHAGNGGGREQLALAAGEQVLERTARPVLPRYGRPSGWVERYRDFSARSELPEHLLQTDKLAALGQMVAGIAHELNNPLTAVMGYAQLLLERPLDAKALADAHRLADEAERAARIVRSLLMLVREAKLDESPIQLNEIVDRMLRLCSYDLRRAGIAVEISLDPDLPSTPANPVQLQQVVLNLLMNAQQAIAETGRPGRIVLRTRREHGRVSLEVEDNGPGIPRELHGRIFEPFFTTKAAGLGTGLGLSIVAGILRQHGGDVDVESEPGAGAKFIVSLPEARERQERVIEGRKLETQAEVAAARILVAEEESGVGGLIVDALSAEGHRVELVRDGKEAVRRAREIPYDLVICDWWMPRLDGEALCRALDASIVPAERRLLLIASDPSLCGSSEPLRARPFACLVKPFLLRELKEAAARLLDRRQEPVAPGQLCPR